jgi:hypothetical protein
MRKFVSIVVLSIAVAVSVAGGSGAAQAYTTFLNENNGSLSNAPFARVDILENGPDIDFTITLLGPDYDSADIESIAFNSTGPALLIGNISGLTNWALDTSSQMAIFGTFDYSINCCTGGGSGTAGQPITFSIVGINGDTVATYASELSTGNGQELFALKTSAGGAAGPFIAGGAVVPIPAALPLFLSGLAVFGFVARRRRSAETA